MTAFGNAFKAARKAKGAGATFEFGGKKYTTDFKEEVAAKNAKDTTPNSSPKADMSNSKVGSKASSGSKDWWNDDNRAAAKPKSSSKPTASATKPKASGPSTAEWFNASMSSNNSPVRMKK